MLSLPLFTIVQVNITGHHLVFGVDYPTSPSSCGSTKLFALGILRGFLRVTLVILLSLVHLTKVRFVLH